MLNPLIIQKPIFTEKTEKMKNSEKAVYVFKILKSANKVEVKKIIENLYKVKVEKVRIIKTPSKSLTRAGLKSVRPGYKKALVTLKKGEKIESLT